MVEIHLFGKLRKYAQNSDHENGSVIRIAPQSGETIALLLARVGIAIEEVYSIFVNHKLLAARSGMARWIGHPKVRSDPFNWDLDIPVNAGDRVGLFGRDMAALVV
jgi:hypothetical protein